MATRASQKSYKRTASNKPVQANTCDTQQDVAKNFGESRLNRKAVKSLQDRLKPKSPTQCVTVEEHFETMFTALHKLQQDGKWCDACLKSKTGSVLAHSAVLMAATPQLCESLNESHPEADGVMRYVDLSHMPQWAVEDLVSFIYSGKVQLVKVRIAMFTKFCKSLGLVKLFEKLQSKSSMKLKDSCDKDLKDRVKNPVDHVKKKISKSDDNKPSVRTRKGSCIKDRSKLDIEKVEGLNVSMGLVSQDRLKAEYASEDNMQKDLHENVEANENLRNFDNIICEKDQHAAENNILGAESNKTIEDDATKGKHAKNENHISIINENDQNKSNDADAENMVCNRMNNSHRGDIQQEGSHKDQPESSQNNISPEGFTVNESAEVNNTADSPDASEDNYSDETDLEYNPPSKKIKTDEKRKEQTTNNSNSTNEKSNKNHLAGTHCKRCKENFDSSNELKKHRKTCKGNRPRKRCILCKISFATAAEYIHHRNTDEKCLEIQRQKHQKRLHRKAQLRARFTCRVCPRKFRRVADHIDHEFVAHDLPYDKEQWPDLFCEYCNYWTMNPWRLHHHKTYDCSKGQEYICDMCGNKYKNEKTLKCHKELQHTDALPMIPCEQCGKTLKGPKGLQHHIKIMHKGENPHKRHMCHICSMKYASSNDLTFHLHKIHSQPLPDDFIVFQCKECDYIINNKRTFEKHRMLHEDKRDFHCELCTKAFKTKNSLHTHMKSHTGKKMPCPYDGCCYAALKKCHLKTHIENQHTQKGVKNEECHLCQYSTFFKGNLIKHLRSVHQLEVVTRYSVQMKAKYKNLKTGDILGKVEQPEPQKIRKKQEPKSGDPAAKVKTKKTNKHDSSTEPTEEITYNQAPATPAEQSKNSREDDTNRKYYPMVDYNRQVTGPVLHNVGANMAAPNENHSYLFTMNNVSMPGNLNSANSLNNVYGNLQDIPADPGSSMHITIPPLSASLREAIPPTYGNKMHSGVTPSMMFHPHAADDDVTNAAKMLTYFQM